ncbi:tRNA 2-thiouridine(34) synthase MnmA [Thermodesulfobacteriota bacterium]
MSNKKKEIVAVGLSGGVDSSVTAALLKDKGYDVIGLSMVIYDDNFKIEDTGRHACYGPDESGDIKSAESVCKKLNIPFHVIDLKNEFNRFVIKYFRNEYLAGRTPNPCIVCNRKLKFGFMLEKARDASIEFDKFATGHYARIIKDRGRYLLGKPLDTSKDQTYFLYSLPRDLLSGILFPLGEYNKKDVREIARSMGLTTSERPESQDFIAGGDFSPFFKPEEVCKGEIVNEKGEVLGKHKGIIHFTVGQRKGLGISSPDPLYVSEIDVQNNRIVVDKRPSLFSKGLTVVDINLISIDEIKEPLEVSVKIRLQHKATPAILTPAANGKAEVVFNEPQLAVTPGQSAVFYDGDIVLGGGIIERALK